MKMPIAILAFLAACLPLAAVGIPGAEALPVTTLYVTHDQTEAMTLGDRIALLREGRVVQTGTPEDLYERPETPFAATFIGQAPMNLLPAEVFGEGDAVALVIPMEFAHVFEEDAGPDSR